MDFWLISYGMSGKMVILINFINQIKFIRGKFVGGEIIRVSSIVTEKVVNQRKCRTISNVELVDNGLEPTQLRLRLVKGLTPKESHVG